MTMQEFARNVAFSDASDIKCAIVGIAGYELTKQEFKFFRQSNPLGFILFKRNIKNQEQVKSLILQLKDCVNRDDVMILVDQEGGRVSRLKEPEFQDVPPAPAFFGEKALHNMDSALELAYDAYKKMGDSLKSLGFNVDCFPMADLFYDNADKVIGDRSFGNDIEIVKQLCLVADKAFKEAKVQSILKHIPGHGRAMADSHVALPVVDADITSLELSDFKVFKELNHFKIAMTAHVIFQALDEFLPVTISEKAIRYIRNEINFHGILITDCISMKAVLQFGSIAEIAALSIKAGCDIVLYCPGDFHGNCDVLSAVPYLSEALYTKLQSLAFY